MSNHTCPFLKNVALAAVCGMGLGLLAAAVDGTWIQPLNDNYNMSVGQYWLHAAVANGGGSVKFINQNGHAKKLNNDVGTLTWNNVDLGASVFTLAGQPVVITGDSILTATSTTGAKFTNDVSFASGATVTKRGAGTVTFCNKVSAPSPRSRSPKASLSRPPPTPSSRMRRLTSARASLNGNPPWRRTQPSPSRPARSRTDPTARTSR